MILGARKCYSWHVRPYRSRRGGTRWRPGEATCADGDGGDLRWRGGREGVRQDRILCRHFHRARYATFQRYPNYFGTKKQLHAKKKSKLSPCSYLHPQEAPGPNNPKGRRRRRRERQPGGGNEICNGVWGPAEAVNTKRKSKAGAARSAQRGQRTTACKSPRAPLWPRSMRLRRSRWRPRRTHKVEEPGASKHDAREEVHNENLSN